MPTAFDQQDLDATMAQITAKITAETEQRSILSKALDIIGALVGTKRGPKPEASDHTTPEETADLSKSEESHVHVHMHNGDGNAGEEEHSDDGMSLDEDREDDAAMADAIVNEILEIFENHYARHDKGGEAMDKSTERADRTAEMVKSLLRTSLEAQTATEARLTALEKSQADLLHEMQTQTQLGSKHTDALDTLGKAMLQFSAAQESLSKSLATLAESQEVRDAQPQPSRYETVRQMAPGLTGQRIAQGFDKKRAVDALAKGLITLQSQEYRDWKYRGIVPEAVQHPLG